MSKQTEFNNYKLVHNFYYPNDPLKKWIDKESFHDYFRKDWDSLMQVVEKITGIAHSDGVDANSKWESVFHDTQEYFLLNMKEPIYQAVIEFIKWYNREGGES